MSEVHNLIVDWLHSQQDWLQAAAEKIIHQEKISDVEIDELCALLKTPEGQRNDIRRDFSSLLNIEEPLGQLRIDSIGEIIGIDKLAPRKPLRFGKNNLTIVYGNNGSGKSGYTRILNKACGKPNAVDLKSNVFTEPPDRQQCTIGYSINGVAEEKVWIANSKALDILKSVDIFDAYTGKIYLDGESDVAYIPPSVAIFEDIVKICNRMKLVLESDKKILVSNLPTNIPQEHLMTRYVRYMQKSLTADMDQNKLKEFFTYTSQDVKSEKNIEERLRGNPANFAQKKRNQIIQIKALLKSVNEAANKVNVKTCQQIYEQQEDTKNTRKIAIEGSEALAEKSVLSGVGTKTWIALWQAAKEYSIAQNIPIIGTDAYCLLCHQSLDVNAKKRLQEFESFVNSILENEAKQAESTYQNTLDTLPIRPIDTQLITDIRAAELDETEWLSVLQNIWKDIHLICGQLKLIHDKAIKGYKLPETLLQPLTNVINTLEEQIVQHDIDIISFDSAKLNLDLNDLKGKKWAAGFQDMIIDEVGRLNRLKSIDEWLKLTNTQTISKKSGRISKAVITQAYIDRFNTELNSLGAKHIKVELVKVKDERGKPKHGIQLRGLAIHKTRTSDILSEGEHRIVSLAAFLADMTGKNQSSPFIFDDPISSLDQTFEEKTIDRLIALSKDRQVIIFTHRLSFLGLINDKINSNNIHQIYVTKEAWGCGEHGEMPLFAKNPISALRNLKNDRLKKAKKALDENGSTEYNFLAKAICSDFRILIERIIECELLYGVIMRHCRSVTTKNKLHNLAKIQTDDCNLIDSLMTKFSCYEHSHSSEAPIALPLPENIEADIDLLLNWHTEFKNRKIEMEENKKELAYA